MPKLPPMKKCAALVCKKFISNKKLMCAGHWDIVTLDLRKALLEAYVLGQGETGKVTPEYRVAVANVVKHVAFREGTLVKEDQDERDDEDEDRIGRGNDDYE